MGKDLEIGVPRNSEIQCETHPSEHDYTKLAETKVAKCEKEPQNDGYLGSLRNNVINESSAQANNILDTQLAARVTQAPSSFSKLSEVQDKTSTELPYVELSLKRLRSIGESRSATQDDRNVLRRSDLSAFSRC